PAALDRKGRADVCAKRSVAPGLCTRNRWYSEGWMPITPATPAPPGFDESALVARARTGDSQAFTDLVNQYQRKIYRLAKHITQNDEDAEDVLQETFLKAY